jgi:two-component system response regulator DesR
MKRAYLADAQLDERSALRLMLQDLNMQVVGEAADWPTALAMAPATHPDLVVVDWGLVADESGAALPKLREICPSAVVIVLISHLDPRHQAALSAGADTFISKGETSDRVAEDLRVAVASIRVPDDTTGSSGPRVLSKRGTSGGNAV